MTTLLHDVGRSPPLLHPHVYRGSAQIQYFPSLNSDFATSTPSYSPSPCLIPTIVTTIPATFSLPSHNHRYRGYRVVIIQNHSENTLRARTHAHAHTHTHILDGYSCLLCKSLYWCNNHLCAVDRGDYTYGCVCAHVCVQHLTYYMKYALKL